MGEVCSGENLEMAWRVNPASHDVSQTDKRVKTNHAVFMTFTE